MLTGKYHKVPHNILFSAHIVIKRQGHSVIMRARKNTKKADTRQARYLHHLHHEEEGDRKGGDDEEQGAQRHELGEHPGPLLAPWQ